MEKVCGIGSEYLYIPICPDREERKLEIFLKAEGETPEKLYEFMVPVDADAAGQYVCEFYAEIPVRQYQGRELLLCGDFPRAFEEGIILSGKRRYGEQERPAIHFTAGSAGSFSAPYGIKMK